MVDLKEWPVLETEPDTGALLCLYIPVTSFLMSGEWNLTSPHSYYPPLYLIIVLQLTKT